jgi:SAM-dependent MidA family methyltransferase
MKKILQKMIEESPTYSITYADFIRAALYDPLQGYYMKDKEKIGTKGDFITTSNISDIFGKLFAKLWVTMFDQINENINICEIGAGNGRFANAVLQEWKNISPDTYERLSYTIVETSPYHRKLQLHTIIDQRKIIQLSAIQQLHNFEGIIFSNELFDAFPVEVIEMKDNILYEVRISLNSNKELIERFVPLEKEEIRIYLNEQEIRLENGQRFEVPLEMNKYLFELSTCLRKGVLFTVDYGYTNEEWHDPIHMDGSLRGFYNHNLMRNPLLHPGEMDLTTHIHFDALITYGKNAGLEFVNIWRQDQFLLKAGILTYLQENSDSNPFSAKSKQNRAIRSLITDCGMSSAFHVVVQEKNVDVEWNSILQPDPLI